MTELLTGWMFSKSSREAHQGLFRKWAIRRGSWGVPPYPTTRREDKENDEAAVIAYGTLNLGLMERQVGDVRNHLQAIGYFRKI